MSSTLESADERLLNAHDLARAALLEITPAATVGDPVGHTVEEGGVVSLRFRNLLSGYPGWFWTVSVAVVEDAEPTVLEVELLPGDGALLAPEWVPWAVRLADYQAAQAALAEAGELDEDEDVEDDAEVSDLDDLDAADFDEDGSSLLHSGDVDGVDIDELDEDAVVDDDLDDDASDDLDDDADEADDSDLDEDSDDEDSDDEDSELEDVDDEDSEFEDADEDLENSDDRDDRDDV